MTNDKMEVRVLRAELLDAHRGLVRARTQVEQLIASNQDLSSQLASTSRQASELLKVTVAFRQLAEAPDEPAAIEALADVAVNVLGTEDFVVLAITDAIEMEPIAGMGESLEQARVKPPSLGDVRASKAHVVPLYIGTSLVGVLSIGSLLEHREPLNAADKRVLDLLSGFAATAIVASRERRRWTRLAAR